MPKLKTKSGAKKRFSLTASGKVKGSPAFLSHNLRKRSQKMKRQARGTMILNDSDAKIVKQFIPYKREPAFILCIQRPLKLRFLFLRSL